MKYREIFLLAPTAFQICTGNAAAQRIHKARDGRKVAQDLH
jgi:hypothetical protein